MKKHLLKTVSLIFAVCLLFSSCGNTVKPKKLSFDQIKNNESEYSGNEFHRVKSNDYKVIGSSGLVELLFNEKTMTPAIRDTNTKMIWTSLPDDTASKEIKSYSVEAVLSNGDHNIYTLNSQDNCVNWGNCKASYKENSITVNYSLSIDDNTGKADINTLTEKQIRVDLTANYYLKDGSFYVNISMNSLKLPKGVYLEKLSVLNNFGSYEQSGEGDYIFVPDGCGALIKTDKEDNEFKPIALKVYGNDNALSNKFEPSSCLYGAYGIKRGNNAFVCIIEQGDSVATINANRNGDGAYNSVYPSFEITDVQVENGKKVVKTYGAEYKNEILLCYRFLAGKSATYSGMATACRENLIRNAVLSTQILDIKEKDLPLVVDIQGKYVGKDGKEHIASDFEQALTLMNLLKAKGVNNVYLRYNGLYNDGNNGAFTDADNFASGLGSQKAYEQLYSYIQGQKFSLFIDTDILSYKYGETKSAKSVQKSNISVAKNADAVYPRPIAKQGFLKLSALENRIDNLLDSSKVLSFDGYSLNDLGAYLYSDYSKDFYSRETAKKTIASQIPVLATDKKIMLDSGNIYSVKNADIITRVPVEPTALKPSKAYVGIPFYQMMLHGILEYSPQEMNAYDDMKYAFLKSVEFGCLPCVSWYCKSLEPTLDKKYYYDNNINDAVGFYEKSNTALSDLRDARMTSHTEIQEGVYCTEYNNSTRIYVNYTNAPVNIKGITIGATDFVRV